MGCDLNENVEIFLPIAVGILSFLGSVFIISVCIYKDLLKGYSFKILVFIAINDIVRSVLTSIPLGLIGNFSYCKIFSYLINVSFFSTIIWSSCICSTIYLILIKGEVNYERYYKYWLILAYPVTAVLEALPYITDSFEYIDGTCSLSNDFYGNIWRFTLLYVPAWSILLYTLAIFIRVYKEVKKTQKSAAKSIIFDRGFVYPIIIAIIIAPLTTLRVIDAFYNSCLLENLIFTSFTFCSLHGFLNFLVFLLNKSVKTSFKIRNPAAQYSLNINDFLTGSSISSTFSSPNMIN